MKEANIWRGKKKRENEKVNWIFLLLAQLYHFLSGFFFICSEARRWITGLKIKINCMVKLMNSYLFVLTCLWISFIMILVVLENSCEFRVQFGQICNACRYLMSGFVTFVKTTMLTCFSSVSCFGASFFLLFNMWLSLSLHLQ